MPGQELPDPPLVPRDLYVVSGMSLNAIARQLAGYKGCSSRQLRRRCIAEKWILAREQHVRSVSAKTEQLAAETEAMMRARLLKSYSNLGATARFALGKVAQRIQTLTVLGKDDAMALNSVARALHLAHMGERSLIDPKDDRVNSIMERAAEIAEGKIDDIVDWNPEEELQQALKPTAMLDLSYSSAREADPEVEVDKPLAKADDEL